MSAPLVYTLPHELAYIHKVMIEQLNATTGEAAGIVCGDGAGEIKERRCRTQEHPGSRTSR
ncbi:hypothetical protein GCM10018779_43020 [Streptomyces griseocarneus]|nr:hypothetical protein GCM10018779_43020 [Streptomyces griseocarneus]